MKPTVSYLLDKCSTMELLLSPQSLMLLRYLVKDEMLHIQQMQLTEENPSPAEIECLWDGSFVWSDHKEW